VVAQREQFHAGLRGRGHDLSRRKGTIRVERVALEIERG
jgi:hypothetical protein